MAVASAAGKSKRWTEAALDFWVTSLRFLNNQSEKNGATGAIMAAMLSRQVYRVW